LTFHTPKRTFVPSSQAVKVRQVLRRRTRVDFVYAARKPLRVDTNLRSGDNIQGLVNSLGTQFLSLLLLAIPVASIAWTITHEDLFREPRDYCKRMSESRAELWQRKFFYLFTCEYCFSHYVAAAFLVITRFKLAPTGAASSFHCSRLYGCRTSIWLYLLTCDWTFITSGWK